MSKEKADQNSWFETRTNLSDEDKFAFELLFKKFPLRPIRTPEQNARAMELAEDLLSRRHDLSAIERDYLEILGDLIHKFESSAYADDDANLKPNEVIRSLIESRGLKQAEVAKELGVTQSRLSEYLNRKRKASKSMARKLATHFALSLDVLLSDAEPDDGGSSFVAESGAEYTLRSVETVSWDRKRKSYQSIKAAADAAGVSFDAYVKVVAYQASQRDSKDEAAE